MRKTLLSLTILAGTALAGGGTATASAAPLGLETVPATEMVLPVQYHGAPYWHHRAWERHHHWVAYHRWHHWHGRRG
jgi:hypothetical protein